MKNLLLFRHAAANHFQENIEDHEKELNEEGRKESSKLASWLDKSQINIDKVYSSTAKRATTTAEILFKNKKSIFSERKLYLCDYLVILKLIKNQSENITDLAIVGHEPSLSETLNFLIGHTRPDLNFFYNNVYPTAGLAIINFNVFSWKKIDQKTGILDAFVTSSYLESYNEKN